MYSTWLHERAERRKLTPCIYHRFRNGTHDSASEPEEDTTEAKQQDRTAQEGSGQDANSNPCFDSAPQDDLEDELEPWVDYMVRTPTKQTTC